MSDLSVEQETQLLAYVCDFTAEEALAMAQWLADLRIEAKRLGLP
jgi:hypothetical protein